ncbi:MAG TPA: farnesyl-diphosphate synthase [Hyphomonas sp.]|nr:farnesyl-diphosphate synthase [Hyphomonas sp.]
MGDVTDFEQRLKEVADRVTVALDQLIPPASGPEANLMRAMRHAALANGKRMRPFFVLETGAMFGVSEKSLLRTAAALECVHCYSLVHDDLPCMDDDDLRRGRPTAHKVFGEGVAVLAGDALLTQAFEILAGARETPRHKTRDFLRELAVAAGSRCLIAGQVADLEAEGRKSTRSELKFIHEGKTAAMIAVSLRLGAMTANATPRQLEALTAFGRSLGLAFQVIDDILDVTQTSEMLGKSAGKDVAAQKTTYPALIGLDGARREARRLTQAAHAALQPFRAKADRLHEIADHLLAREY